MTEIKGRLRTVALAENVSSPITTLADAVVELPYADEMSVVQTRYATTALVYLLTSLNMDLTGAIDNANNAVSAPVALDLIEAEQFHPPWYGVDYWFST